MAQAFRVVQEAFADAQRASIVMSSEELAAQVDGAQRVINAASAVQAVRVAQFAARQAVVTDEGEWEILDHGVGYVDEFAGDCFGPMLGMSPVTAERKAHTAAAWVSRLPQTLAAMAAGDLDPWRATVIAAELSTADREVCAQVEDRLYPRVLAEAPGRARARVRRELAVVDLDSLRDKAARARLDRFVRLYPSDVVGMTEWLAQLPTADSVACKAAIDELAHQMATDDPDRTLDQCRADAFVDLILGNASVSTTVSFAIPVETASTNEPPPYEPTHSAADEVVEVVDKLADGCDAGGLRTLSGHAAVVDPVSGELLRPAQPSWQQVCAMGLEVPGVGVVPGDVVARICQSFETRITRVLLDTRTGVVRESGIRHYQPPPRMIEFVRLRDGTCRFPGCARAARRCDLDHVVAYPQGATTATNLLCLCRHHHRAKHQTAWRVSMDSNGVCSWTDPFGQQYRTEPVDHHALAA